MNFVAILRFAVSYCFNLAHREQHLKRQVHHCVHLRSEIRREILF